MKGDTRNQRIIHYDLENLNCSKHETHNGVVYLYNLYELQSAVS